MEVCREALELQETITVINVKTSMKAADLMLG